jgi:methylmalonyl-CoA mutase cobalamin-binding subunit
VLLPALATTEADHYRNATDEDRHEKILAGFKTIVDEFADRLRAERKKLAAQNTVHQARGEPPVTVTEQTAAPDVDSGGIPAGCSFNVICVPAHADADDIAGRMIGLLLELRGYCVTYASADQLAGELVRAAETARADLVIVSALPPAAVTHARYICKRLHEHLPDLPVVVGLWTAEGDLSRATDRIAGPDAVRSAATLPAALECVHELAQPRLAAGVEKS